MDFFFFLALPPWLFCVDLEFILTCFHEELEAVMLSTDSGQSVFLSNCVILRIKAGWSGNWRTESKNTLTSLTCRSQRFSSWLLTWLGCHHISWVVKWNNHVFRHSPEITPALISVSGYWIVSDYQARSERLSLLSRPALSRLRSGHLRRASFKSLRNW